jgi:hypothetical protein
MQAVSVCVCVLPLLAACCASWPCVPTCNCTLKMQLQQSTEQEALYQVHMVISASTLHVVRLPRVCPAGLR